MLCHDKVCCCNKGHHLTQDVFWSIMIEVSVLWKVVDLGAHTTLHPYKQTDRNIRGKTSLQQASHTAHMLLLSLTENELQHCTSIKTPHTFPQMCLHDHTLMYKHSPHFLAECSWIILIFNTHLDHN